jgi:hypothetical protein
VVLGDLLPQLLLRLPQLRRTETVAVRAPGGHDKETQVEPRELHRPLEPTGLQAQLVGEQIQQVAHRRGVRCLLRVDTFSKARLPVSAVREVGSGHRSQILVRLEERIEQGALAGVPPPDHFHRRVALAAGDGTDIAVALAADQLRYETVEQGIEAVQTPLHENPPHSLPSDSSRR